jgi:hypothetical protein
MVLKNPLVKILKNFEKLLKPSKNTQYWVFFEGFFLSNFHKNKPNYDKEIVFTKSSLSCNHNLGG